MSRRAEDPAEDEGGDSADQQVPPAEETEEQSEHGRELDIAHPMPPGETSASTR